MLFVEEDRLDAETPEPGDEVAPVDVGGHPQARVTGPGERAIVQARIASARSFAAAGVDEYLVLLGEEIAVLT